MASANPDQKIASELRLLSELWLGKTRTAVNAYLIAQIRLPHSLDIPRNPRFNLVRDFRAGDKTEGPTEDRGGNKPINEDRMPPVIVISDCLATDSHISTPPLRP